MMKKRQFKKNQKKLGGAFYLILKRMRKALDQNPCLLKQCVEQSEKEINENKTAP